MTALNIQTLWAKIFVGKDIQSHVLRKICLQKISINGGVGESRSVVLPRNSLDIYEFLRHPQARRVLAIRTLRT